MTRTPDTPRPPNAKDALGLAGESAAAGFLARKGYRVICRRWRSRHGEIDLIVRDGDEVVFVEVKTRRGGGFGLPEEAVTKAKRERLRRSAEEYLDGHPGVRRWRIDVVAVEVAGADLSVRHLPYAVGEDD